MKTKRYLILIILFTGVFLISSCRNEENLKPNGVKITFQAVTGLKSSADTLIIDEALMGIGAIDLKLEGETDSAKAEKIVYNGPYVVDLLNGHVSPAIHWIFAEPGYYSEIDVTTYNSLHRGKTIVLKGALLPVGGQKEIPFEFFTSSNYTFKIKSNDGITVSEGEEIDLLVVFNLSDLFRDIDLTAIQKNENGVVVISEDEGSRNIGPIIQTFEAFSSFGINDGLPFTGDNDVVPDNEFPDEGENPEEENNDGDVDENDPSSGDADENEGSAGGEDNSGDGNSNDNEDGGLSEDDDSKNDDEKKPDSGSDDDEEDQEPGSNEDEQDSENKEQDNDDDDGDEGEDGDDGDDDAVDEVGDDSEDGDDGEDDASDDDSEGDGDDRDDDDDKDNPGKGKDNNPGKGKDKKEDKGKGNKG